MSDITQARTEGLSDDQIVYVNSIPGSGVKLINVSGEMDCFSGDESNVTGVSKDEADQYIDDAAGTPEATINAIGGVWRPCVPRGSF